MSKKPRKPATKSAIIDVAILDAKCHALLKDRQTLASDAKVSYKTIQRAAAGRPISYTYIKLIADVLGIPPYALIKADTVPLAPVGTAVDKKRLTFAGELDVPAEMFEAFQREELAFKFFVALYLSDLIKDGAANIRLINGSILAAAELTPQDIRRLLNAFLAGNLESQRVIGIRTSALPLTRSDSGDARHKEQGAEPVPFSESSHREPPGMGAVWMNQTEDQRVAAKIPSLLKPKVRKLADQGMSPTEIAAYLDVSLMEVHEALRSLPMKPDSTSEESNNPADDA
jgi:hypothetical protein